MRTRHDIMLDGRSGFGLGCARLDAAGWRAYSFDRGDVPYRDDPRTASLASSPIGRRSAAARGWIDRGIAYAINVIMGDD
jgi:hypothetical protein